MSDLRLDLDAVLDELASRVAERLHSEPVPPAVEAWRLLDVQEAAARLGRSTRWVRERVRRGELARVRLDGGALAFDPDDLREFARERRIGGNGAGP